MGWTEEQLRDYERRQAQGKRKAGGDHGSDPAGNPDQTQRRERASGHELHRAVETPGRSPARLVVLIELRRKRLLDKENAYLATKALTDALRYAGAIAGDSEQEIDLEVNQTAIKAPDKEITVVQVIPNAYLTERKLVILD